VIAMTPTVQIVADIGGTHARFAYVEEGSTVLQGIEVFPCADFPFLVDAVLAYIARAGLPKVATMCLAVAGTVAEDLVDLPNNHWCFSRAELQRQLAIPLQIINDFDAQILAIDLLNPAELLWLGAPRPTGSAAVKAAVGPGTGLGVSAMLQSGDVVPSEGGHVAFAPADQHEIKLLEVLWQRYHRVSVERLLSGMGLANLYWANAKIDGLERELPAAEVSAGARAGDRYCLAAIRDFTAILGSVAGDSALVLGATGGVYLSGGVVPKLMDLLDQRLLRQRFDDKGRFGPMMETTPLAIVQAAQPGLLGCVEGLRRGE
jgi:glucokinase